MSKFTDYAENKIADFFRGQGLTLPTAWFFALGTAADDATFTETTGTGYSRHGLNRSLANFAGTQGAGTTLVSSGTSHLTSNNAAVSFGTASGSWGTISHYGLFDAVSSGHCWMYVPLAAPLTISNGDAVQIDASTVQFTLGLTGGTTDYLSNKMIDLIWRNQTFTWPSATYISLFTVAPTNATGTGTEVSGGSYARVSLASSMSALSGTQSAGSTSASTGTGGQISNNNTLMFNAPTADWGTVVAQGIHDASTAGNLLFYGSLSTPKTINNGASAPTHAPGSIIIQIA